MYYPYSENKGDDQLHGYREADLRLCFRICKKPFYSRHGSYNSTNYSVFISVKGVNADLMYIDKSTSKFAIATQVHISYLNVNITFGLFRCISNKD